MTKEALLCHHIVHPAGVPKQVTRRDPNSCRMVVPNKRFFATTFGTTWRALFWTTRTEGERAASERRASGSGERAANERRPNGERTANERRTNERASGERTANERRTNGGRTASERRTNGGRKANERRTNGERTKERAANERRTHGAASERRTNGERTASERRTNGDRTVGGERTANERRTNGERTADGRRANGERTADGPERRSTLGRIRAQEAEKGCSGLPSKAPVLPPINPPWGRGLITCRVCGGGGNTYAPPRELGTDSVYYLL